jgi:hypothetical protein
MVITDLDKRWCRWQTREWIIDGKIAIRPCAVCGDPDSYVVHLNWHNPVAILWLCKTHRSETRLSGLQRTLLHRGLEARREGNEAFDLKGLWSLVPERLHRDRCRIAASLSLKRLIKRGLLERCGYGQYRLTQTGVQTARRLL